MVIAAFVISVFALVGSGGAVWYTRSLVLAQGKTNQMVDQARAADVIGEWKRQFVEDYMTGTLHVDLLTVTNHGPAPALVVEVHWYSGQAHQDPEAINLAPGESHEFEIKIQDRVDSVKNSITWRDGRPERQTGPIHFAGEVTV